MSLVYVEGMPTTEERIERLETILDRLVKDRLHLPYCENGKCEPCACSKMADLPHRMYCLNDLTPEMLEQWRADVSKRVAQC